MNIIAFFGFVFCFVLFGSFKPAAAYIDPASTSYLLELIIGLVVLGGAAFGYYWRKIKNKIRKTDTVDEGVSAADQLADADIDDED